MRIYIILSVLSIFGCTTTRTIDESKVDRNSESKTQSTDLSAAKYYYLKYFDEMVNSSLSKGFSVYEQFGDVDSYVIIKSASILAAAGDTVVKRKMINFWQELSGSKNDYETDESITVLIDFYLGVVNNKDLFEAGLEFLDPKHLYKDINTGADYGTDYTGILFDKLQKVIVPKAREFYNSKFMNLYADAIKRNSSDIPREVWSKFYPYLVQEMKSNKIQFVSN